MVQGKAPWDAAVITRNAGYLEALAKMPWDGFQPATAEVKDTDAKPEIYREADKYQPEAAVWKSDLDLIEVLAD